MMGFVMDEMRTNLITHFHCSDCGNQLIVKYNGDDSPQKISLPGSKQTDKEPTGAACRYIHILVQPCQPCINKHTEPARKIADAIMTINSIE